MDQRHILGAMDYVVIVFSLLVSAAIGIKFRYFSVEQKTMKEYIMAGKDMAIFPVVISICVTLLSAMTIISNPVESYRYGMQLCLTSVGGIFGTCVSSYVFTPVYYNCEVSTIYEFLELRYGKVTRYTVSALFIMQMVFFISVMLYAPVLAISAVTDLSLEMSVIVFGLVCSFYCTIGGLKAVLWTDVFQGGFMFICIIVLYVQGVNEGGGLQEIYRISKEGLRWNLLNLDIDFTVRYTLWNTLLRGFLGTMAYYGASQIEVQRVQSLRSVTRARAALLWSLLPSIFISVMCKFFGMVLYSIFYTCDPVQDGQRTGIKRYDQVVPYYIVTRLSWIPGLTGVCVAGIFSGSLSSVSSALNSLSTVTVVDFIHPLFPNRFTESRMVYIAKALSMLYGVVCIGMTFLISRADSLVAVAGTLLGIVEGPILAIFLVAVLTRKGTEKCILFGLMLGVCLMSWIGYGSLFSGYRYPTLPLNKTGCSSDFSNEIFSNSTCEIQGNCMKQLTSKNMLNKETFILYRISFMWIPTIGCFITILFIFVAILLTGWNHNVIPADSKCLSPVTRFWIRKQHSHKRQIGFTDNIDLEEKNVLSTSRNQID